MARTAKRAPAKRTPARARKAAAPAAEPAGDNGGYEEPRTIVRLVFGDGRHAGLVVRAYAAPADVVEECAELAFVDGQQPLKRDQLTKVRQVVARFGEELVSWNLVRDGAERPAMAEAVRRLDLVFAWELVAGWIAATRQVVDGRLAEVTPDDAGDLDESQLPMEPAG